MTTAEPRFVLDTNVFVSAILIEYSLPWRALRHATDHGRLLLSEETLLELRTVVDRPKFNRYAEQEHRRATLNDVLALCITVPIQERITACRDPRDDKFLEVAVNGGASCIVTGDDDLLVLNPFRGMNILTPRDFLNT